MSQLRQIVDAVLDGAMRIPGAQPVGRSLAYGLTRSHLLSDKNRMRVHNLIGRKVIPPGMARARVPIPELPGVSLSLELGLADELSRFWYFFGYDHYEAPVRRTLAALVAALPPDPQWRFLDVGGNIGYFTLYLAALARAGGKGAVHSFEPSPHVFRMLARNLALNPGLPVTLNEAAVSDAPGTCDLFLADESFGHSGASLVCGAVEQVGSVRVRTLALDDYSAKIGGKVAIVKLDCEGVETKALAGLARTFERDSPHIVMEILPRYPNMPAELAALPFFAHYRKFQITTEGLVEHDGVRPSYENRDWLLSVAPPVALIRKPA